MTTPTHKRLAEMRERAEKAHQEICDLAAGKIKWEMCVPVQPTDSDVTLQAPIDDLAILLKVVEVYERALEFIGNEENYFGHNGKTPHSVGELQTKAREARTEAAKILGEG